MIEVKHLTRRYGMHTAVDDLSFTLEKGKVYGFLGPNGAGKSTTMNMMTGCLAATSGDVRINGHDILEEPKAAKASVGYLPEVPPLYPDMTPRELLAFVGEVKGLKKAELHAQIDEVMALCGVTDVADRLIGRLSKGYKQRVGMAQAILGYPEHIILDEPTAGLDPRQITEVRELLRSLKDDHMVLLSSHILSEISAVCDEVLIIAQGRLVAIDTPEHLMSGDQSLEEVFLALTEAREQVSDDLVIVSDHGPDVLVEREEDPEESPLALRAKADAAVAARRAAKAAAEAPAETEEPEKEAEDDASDL